MEILSSTITGSNINLVTNIPVARLVLSYGSILENTYEITNINSEQINISKSEIEILDNLYNIYFKLELYDSFDNVIKTGLFYIEVINNLKAYNYDARKLKQDLDNLNYYEGIIESLTFKEEFLGANDFFYNYIEYLTNELYGGSLESIINSKKYKIKTTCK